MANGVHLTCIYRIWDRNPVTGFRVVVAPLKILEVPPPFIANFVTVHSPLYAGYITGVLCPGQPVVNSISKDYIADPTLPLSL